MQAVRLMQLLDAMNSQVTRLRDVELTKGFEQLYATVRSLSGLSICHDFSLRQVLLANGYEFVKVKLRKWLIRIRQHTEAGLINDLGGLLFALSIAALVLLNDANREMANWISTH